MHLDTPPRDTQSSKVTDVRHAHAHCSFCQTGHSDVSYIHLLQLFSLLKLMTDVLLYTACIPHNTTEFPIIESTEKSYLATEN